MEHACLDGEVVEERLLVQKLQQGHLKGQNVRVFRWNGEVAGAGTDRDVFAGGTNFYGTELAVEALGRRGPRGLVPRGKVVMEARQLDCRPLSPLM